MAFFRIAVVNEDKRPIAGVDVEAIDLTDRTVSAVVQTNRSGEALFTGLTGPHFFRPRVRRVSGEVGGRHFTGSVEVQVVGFDTNCMDYTVDSGGGGTHTTLASAVADAITAAGTSGTRTIWLCGSVTEGSIDIGGLGTSARIIITSPDKYRAQINAPVNEDIFVQGSSGGNVAGALIFRNIGLNPSTGNWAVYYVNTGSEIRNIIFESCNFVSSYLCRQSGTVSLGNVYLQVRDCTGTPDGFFLTNSVSAAVALDVLEGFNNRLTLTRWWQNLNANNAPNFVRIQGGLYSVSNGLTLPTDAKECYWKDLILLYSGAGAAFITGAASSNIRDVAFDGIIFRVSQATAYFGSFGSGAINNNFGLFLKNIFGHTVTGLTITATDFINVDTDYLNVHAGNILARGAWTNTYVGPNSGFLGDHGTLSGLVPDDDHTQYALLAGRAGGQNLRGGTAASETLDLRSTANATLGAIRLEGDINFALSLPAAGPRTTVDTGDYIQYTRAADTWEFVAGAQTHLALAPAQASFATPVSFHGDPNFVLQLVGGNPLWTVDAGDAFTYVRAGNRYDWTIANNIVFSAGASFLDFGRSAGGVAARFQSFAGVGGAGAQLWLMTGNNADQWVVEVQPAASQDAIQFRASGATSKLEIATTGIRMADYLRVGSVAAPANVTAGDLTFVRAFINNDSNFNLQMSGSDPRITFDTYVSLRYVRAAAPDGQLQVWTDRAGAAELLASFRSDTSRGLVLEGTSTIASRLTVTGPVGTWGFALYVVDGGGVEANPRMAFTTTATGGRIALGAGGASALDLNLSRITATDPITGTSQPWIQAGRLAVVTRLALESNAATFIDSGESSLRLEHWRHVTVLLDRDGDESGELFRVMNNASTIAAANLLFQVNASGDARILGALDHDGATIGFFGVAPAVRAAAYTITNALTDRAYDADTVAVAELADVVATLVADLTSYGLLQ